MKSDIKSMIAAHRPQPSSESAERVTIVALDHAVAAMVADLCDGFSVVTCDLPDSCVASRDSRLVVVAAGDPTLPSAGDAIHTLRARHGHGAVIILACPRRSGTAHDAIAEGAPDDWFFLADDPREIHSRLAAAVGRCRRMAESSGAHRVLRDRVHGYEELFERLPCGAYESTPDGRFLRVNNALVAMLGYGSAEELMAIDIGRELYVESDVRPRLLAALESWHVLDGVELVFRRKDGSTVVLLEHAYLRRDREGRPVSYVGTLSDITGREEERRYLKDVSERHATTAEYRAAALERANLELKRRMAELEDMRARLQASEREYRSLVENLAEGVYSTGTDGVLEYANPALARLLGLPVDEIVGQHIASFIHPDDAPERRRNFELILEGAAVTSTFRVVAADGSARHVVSSARRRDEADGRVTLHGVLTDITALRAAEQREQWTRNLLHSAFEQSPAGIMIALTDSERLVLMNHAALDFVGLEGPLPAEGIPRREVWRQLDITAGDGRPLPLDRLPLSRALAGEVVHKEELRITRRDGSTRHYLLNAAPVRGPDGSHDAAVAVVSDISARREMEARLHRAETMESLGRLAGSAAHDFNNFVTAISGAAQLLESQLDAPELVAEVGVIRRAAAAAAELSRSLLRFARREELDLQPLDLGRTVEDSLPLLRRVVGRGMTVSFEPAGTPLPVLADRASLDRILVNLCLNSRDACSATGRILIRTGQTELPAASADPPGVAPGRYAVLSVADDGPGMPPGVAARVLEPFFTTKSSGSGLGLPAVYGAVLQHRGRLEIETAPDEGNTIHIWLPLLPTEKPEDGVEGEDATPAVVPGHHGATARLLVAEDHDELREIVCAYLRSLGHQVVEAGDGDTAFNLLAEHADRFDIVVTDVDMPGLDGFEIVRRVRQHWPHLGLILCSGDSRGGRSRSDDVDDDVRQVEKPFEIEDLGRAVASVLDADGWTSSAAGDDGEEIG